MSILTDIFPGGFSLSDLPQPRPLLAPDAQLRVAMSDAGLAAPDHLIFDGKIHRFSTSGKRNDDSGWYVAYEGKIAAGAFGDWRQGLEVTWRADIGRELSHIEQMQHAARMREMKAQREREMAVIREEAAENAAVQWEAAQLASDDHPYLRKKGITNPGMRVGADGRLIAPMYFDGNLVSLQYIDADGGKKMLKGGKAGGAWWSIGGALDKDCSRVYIAEGVATAASIFEATGKPVAIAYSAGSLAAVAKSVRDAVGIGCEIVIVADNDESGVGQRESEKAAQFVGASVIMPPMTGDANDYAQAGHDLSELLLPNTGESWLIPADDFSAQPAPISWLVKHWLQRDALIMVHGPSGGGKTFVVLDWCLSMASHITEWAGHKVNQGNIVYLAGEGHHGLRGRVAAWKHRNKAKSLSMWLSRDGCDLNTPEGYLRVANAIRQAQIKPSLIVVDTLHRFLHGDENSAQDAKTMLDACNSLMREFGCSVLLVHHTGVSDEAQHRARGSSAWRGALDIEISIVPAKGDHPMQIVQRKSKDAELAREIYATLQSVEIPGWFDEDGQQVTSAVVQIEEAPPASENKKEKSISKHIKTFENAWFNSGAENRGGAPYLSRSALINYLVQNLGIKEESAKLYCKPSQPNRPISEMLLAEIITVHEHGWIVIDQAQAGAMMLRRGAQ